MPEDEVKTPGYVGSWSDDWEARHNASIWGVPNSGIYPRTVEQDACAKPRKRHRMAIPKSHETAENSSTTNNSGEYYDKGKILAALSDLSAINISRIQSFSRFRLFGKTGRAGHAEVEDLFMDAVLRTMELKRNWAEGISSFNHLFAVMRSINHQRFKQAARYTSLNELIPAPQGWSPSTLDAQNMVSRLKEQLSGDAVALSILDSMMDEMRPRDAQQLLGIRADVYWAARKRIRRQAENLPGALSLAAPRPPKRPSPSDRVFQMSLNRMG